MASRNLKSDTAVADLSQQLEQARSELAAVRTNLDLVIRSSRWLVWSCRVEAPRRERPWWVWDFREELCPELPAWFDVVRLEVDNLGWMIARARLEEDNEACAQQSIMAMWLDYPGYSQTFRIRLRSGEVSWIEENVIIHPVSFGVWDLTGVCINATERMEAQERLRVLQAELVEQNKVLMERERLREERRALLAANARLEDLAITDALTGVRNYRGFRDYLDRTWQASEDQSDPISVVLIDIDLFKPYNDAYGHPAGDRVLQTIGTLLREYSRTDDCVARYGGEEFVLVLPSMRALGATAIAERLRTAIEQTTWPHRPITASFGVATAEQPSGDAQWLIDAADKALYLAKAHGRNRVCHTDGEDPFHGEAWLVRPHDDMAADGAEPVAQGPSQKV